MSNPTADYPDWRRDVITPGHNLLQTGDDHWTADHTYGPFYVGDARSIQVVWNEGNPGVERTLTVQWFTAVVITAAQVNPLLANQGGTIAATLPVLAENVSLLVGGGTVPNPTDTTLRLDAFRAEAVQEFAVSDLVLGFTHQVAVPNNGSFTFILSPVVPGAATISSFCPGGAHRIQVQFMDLFGNWQPCGGVDPGAPDGVFTAALPSRPCRLVGLNLSGAASDMWASAIHVAHQ